MNSLRNLTDVDLDQLDRSDADLAIPAADAAAAAPPDQADLRHLAIISALQRSIFPLA